MFVSKLLHNRLRISQANYQSLPFSQPSTSVEQTITDSVPAHTQREFIFKKRRTQFDQTSSKFMDHGYTTAGSLAKTITSVAQKQTQSNQLFSWQHEKLQSFNKTQKNKDAKVESPNQLSKRSVTINNSIQIDSVSSVDQGAHRGTNDDLKLVQYPNAVKVQDKLVNKSFQRAISKDQLFNNQISRTILQLNGFSSQDIKSRDRPTILLRDRMRPIQ